MTPFMEFRVLLPEDAEALIKLAKTNLANSELDEIEVELATWTARWRAESLAHYLAQGWSYASHAQNEITGFILCQPLLFFRGNTQTLWVEDLVASTEAELLALVDVAFKWARDKHFQVLLMEKDRLSPKILKAFGDRVRIEGSWIEIKATRQ